MERWEPICIYCGKKCSGATSRPASAGKPTMNPPIPSGKCPSSPDGKHKPRWEQA